MNNSLIRRFFLILLFLGSVESLRAQTETVWQPTAAGSYSWLTNSNWNPATAPNSISAIASLSADLVGAVTINLGGSIQLDILTIGDTSTLANSFFGYTVGTAGENLIFNNTNSVAALLTKNGSATDTIAANLVVNDGLNVTVNAATLDLSGAFQINGNVTNPSIESLSKNGGGTFSVTGNTTLDEKARIAMNAGTMNLSGLSNVFRGQVNTSGGTLNIRGGNNFFVAPPASDSSILVSGGAMQFGSSSGTTNSYLSGPLTLSAGTINFGAGAGAANVVLNSASITMTGGTLRMQNSTGGGNTTILAGSPLVVTASLISVGNTTINMSTTAGLATGMRVYGAGIPDGALIQSIVANTSITLNSGFAPTIANTNVPLMIGTGVAGRTGSTTLGSNVITSVADTTGFAVGQTVTGNGIPLGARIANIVPNTSITLDTGAFATATASGVSISAFSPGMLTLNGGTTETNATGSAAGTLQFDPSISLVLNNAAIFNFSDNTSPAIARATANGTNTLTVLNNTGFSSGQTVTGTGIPGGTTITAVGAGSITLSNTIVSGIIDNLAVANVGKASATTTNNSTIITGLTDTSQLAVGMSVTGTNIPAGAVITSINSTTSVTLSVEAVGSGVITNFSAGVAVGSASTTAGSNQLLVLPGSTAFKVGDTITGTNIPSGSQIIAIIGNTLVLNQAATGTGNISNLAVNQNLVLNSITSTSNNSVLRLSSGNGVLSAGNYSATNDTFNGILNFSGAGASGRLVKVGSNTLTLGGTQDNPSARVEVQEGTLVLAKDSLPSVHAIGTGLIIGDADASTETVQIGGTFAAYSVLNSLPSNVTPLNNYRNQIFRGADVTINPSGVLDLNGNSEGFNALLGRGFVRNNGATAATLMLGQNNSSFSFAGLIQDGTGATALIKAGTGTMMLFGNNSYSGSTLSSFGVLTLAGTEGGLSNTSVLRVADSTVFLDNTLTLLSGSVSDGSRVANVFSTRGLVVGDSVTGNGIAGGTVVAQIINETQFLMSTFATSNQSGQTFTTNRSTPNSNRIGNSTDLYLSNGTFTIRNAPVLGTNIQEKMGDLGIDVGHSILRIDHLTNVANMVRMDFDSYTRVGGSILSVVENSGANGFGTGITPDLSPAQVTVGAVPSAYLIGGGGLAGTNTVNLLLGAFGGNVSNATSEFMTVQTIGGVNYIRPLNAGGSEYATLTSGNVSSQVATVSANTVISANTAYNSLRFVNQDRLITISDGVTLKLGGNDSVNFTGTGSAPLTTGAGMMIMNSNAQNIRGGTLDFGAREFILRGNGSTVIQSSITGTNPTNGLTKGGGGHLDILGANTYTGQTVVAQGLIRVFNSRGLGASGTGNGTRLLTGGLNGDTLMIGNGVVIGNSGSLEDLIMEMDSRFSGADQNNVWYGNIILDSTSESGQNNQVYIRTRSDTAILTINGNITGGGNAVEPGFNGAAGRQLFLIGDNLRDGIININGALSDQNGLSAFLGDHEKLNLLVRGTTTPNLPVNEFAVNIQDASKLHGQLDLRSGIVRLAGNYGTDASFSGPGVTTGPTLNMIMRLRESGSDSPNQLGVFAMTTPGTTYNVGGITWGDNTAGYSATSYGMLAAEINSGVVTIGNGTGSLDMTPNADSVGGQSFTGTGTITLWDGVVNPSNPNLNNIVTLTGYAPGKQFGHLRPGMQLTGNNVPNGTYIVQLEPASGKITLNNAITGNTSQVVNVNFIFNDAVPNSSATQNFADARLYAMEGGELNLRMRLLDDGGFSLENEVGAVTKVGRGTVRLSGAAGLSGELDGGMNLHGGTLLLDYTQNSLRKLTSGANQQVPITLAGGDVHMLGNATAANSTEEMRGVLFMRPGESLIRVQSGGLANTATLNIGLPANLLNNVGMLPVRFAGSSVAFWRDTQLGGNSEITLEIPDGFTGSIVLPWAVMAANQNDPTSGVYRGKIIDFATVSAGNSVTDPLGVRAAGADGLFRQENAGGYFGDAINGSNGKNGYIAETSEILSGEGSGFFGYVENALTFGNLAPGDSGVRILLFNIDNNNTSGTDLGSVRGPEEFNNVLRINPGQTLELQSNDTGTGLKPYYLGGAILIANTVGDTHKEITGGSISSGLVTSYFDPNVNNLLTKAYDLIVHNYANAPDETGPGGNGGIFTIGSDIVNNPGAPTTPLNFVHSGTGTTRMIRASTLGAGYSYTGTTYFNGGVVWASDPNKLGANPLSFDEDNLYFTGGELRLGSMTNSLGTTGLADDISTSSITLNANRGIMLGGDGGFIIVEHAGTTFTINSKISVEPHAPTFAGGVLRASNLGLGDLFKDGLGTMVLTNQTNTYSGLTGVENGTLQANLTASVVPANLAQNATFQNQGVLGSSYSFIDGTFVDAGASLRFRSLVAGFGSAEWITLDGGTLGTAAGHLDGNLEGVIRVRANSTIDVLSGGILRLNTDAGYMTGTGSLTKTGAGTLGLFENSTDFTGNWEIKNGRVMGVSQGVPLGSGTTLLLGDTNADTGGVAELLLSSRVTPTVVISNVTTTTSTTITMSSTDGLYAGMQVSGAFIPAGAVITQVVDGTRIIISAAPSAGTGNITATLGTSAFPLEYTVNQNITVQSDGAGSQVKRLGVGNHSLLLNSGQQNDVFSFNGSLTLNEDLLLSYGDATVNTGIAASGRDAIIILGGNISGSGNLQTEILYSGDTTGINSNDLRVAYLLEGNNSGWNGSITLGNAALEPDQTHVLRLASPTGQATKSNNHVTMGFNSIFQVGGGTATIGNLTINPTGLAMTNQVFIENAANEAGVLRITQTANETWDAIFRDGVTPALATSANAAVPNNTLGVVKLGAGTAVMNQTNTYAGVTQVGSANGVSGGVLSLGAGGAINSASALTVFAGVFDNSSGAAQTFARPVTLGGGASGTTSTLSSTGALSVNVLESDLIYSAANNPGSASVTGRLDLGALNRTINVADSTGTVAELTIAAGISGEGGGILKTGAGVLVLSGGNTFTGGTNLSQGTLVLDYGTNNSSKLSDSSALTLGGGILQLSGGSHLEVVASSILASGTSTIITRAGGSSAVLQMNTITVGSGATVNFVGSGIASTDNLNNAAGILGGWATITIGGVTDWAMNSTNSADGLITAYTGYTDIPRLGPSSQIPNTPLANVRIDNGGSAGSITLASATTQISTLKMDANAGGAMIDAAGRILSIGDELGGAILQTSGAGGLTVGTSAGSGTLTTGGTSNATAATLSLINESGTNPLTVNAVVANNGSDVVNVIKSGAGAVVLNAANTYSGVTTVLSGTLVAGSGTAFGPSSSAALRFGDASTGRVQLNGFSVTVTGLNSSSVLGAPILESGSSTAGTDTLTVNNTAASTYAGLLQDGGTRKLGLAKSGSGVLTLAGQNTFSGLTTVSAGTLAYGASNALGSGDVTVSGATAALSLGQFSDTVGILILDNGGSISGSSGVLTSTGDFDFRSGNVSAVLAGTVGLVKTTSGTVVLSGANAYTGATSVNAGVLNLRNNNALGTTAAGTSVAAGAALQVQDGITVMDSLTLNGTGIGNDGALRSVSGNNTLSGLVTLGGAARINTDSGSLLLSNAGTISGAGFGLTVGGSGTTTINSIIGTAGGTLVKDGTGTLNLAGVNTYTGATTISSGIVHILNGAALGGTAAGTSVASGAALQIQGDINVGAEALTLSGTGVANGGALRSLNGNNSFGGLLTLGGSTRINTDAGNLFLTNAGTIAGSGFDLTVGGAGNTQISGALATGTGAILKDGTGTLTLAGANTYTGATTITAGVVNVRNAQALGATTNGTTVAAGAALQIQNDAVIGAEALSLAGVGINNDGALRSISGNNLYGGLITLVGASRINADVGSLLTLDVSSGNAITGTQNMIFGGEGNINVNDNINIGTGTLTKDGSGMLTLVAANTYTGLTTISAGTLTLGINDAFSTGAVTVDGATAVLNMGAFSDSVGQVILANGASIVGTGVLTSTAAFDVRAGSATARLGGLVGLNKTTSGSVTLGGNNTYTGGTTLSAGTLTLDYNAGSSSRLSDTGVLTLGGGTLELAGGNHTEVVVSTSLTAGTTTVVTRNSGSSVLEMNTITVGAGALVRFMGSGIATTNNTNTTAGILGSWATVSVGGATDWAVNSTNLSDGLITAYTAYTNINRLGVSAVPNSANANVRIINGGTSGNITLAATTTQINTLKMEADAGPAIIDPTNATDILNIGDNTGGGILVSSTAGALTIGATANDGRLTTGANANTTSATLIFINDSIANALTINSTITNNGTVDTDIVGITKAGAGSLVLNGTNTYTGLTTINAGALNYGVINAISTGGITVDGATAVLNMGTFTDTVGQVILANGGSITGTGTGALSSTAAFDMREGTATSILGGSVGLNKTTDGTVVLSGANTYTGAVAVSAGVLNIRSAAALGTTAAGTTVATGAVLELQGNFTVGAEALTLNGTGIANAGAMRHISGNNTYGGAITLSQATRINSDAGTLTLDVASGNAITATNLALTFGGAGNITVNDAIATGSGNVTKDGAGTLTLAGANTYTGATSVSNGVLNIRNAAALGTVAAGTTVASGAQLQIQNSITTLAESLTLSGTGINNSGALRNIIQDNTFAGAITLAGATRINSDSGNLNLNVASGDAIAGNFDLTFGGAGNVWVFDPINTGVGRTLTKDGSATLLLRAGAQNTYTGVTNVLSGALRISGSLGLGTTDSGTIVASGARLELQLDTASFNVGNEALTLTGVGGGVGALRNISGFNSYGGQITLGGATLIFADDDSLTLDVSSGDGIVGDNQNLSFGGGGNIFVNDAIATGSGTLTKTGAGTLTLNAANKYIGTTTINTGSVVYGVNNAISSGDVVVDGLTAVLNIGNFSDTVGVITLANGGTISGSAGVLSSSSGLDFRSGTVIAALGGTANLVKTTSGTVSLLGSNTFTGSTTLNLGTLKLDYTFNNDSKLSDSGTLVLGGGTLELAGGSHMEAVASTTLLPGTSSTITRTSGTSVLQMNLITPGSGSLVNFTANGIATTDNRNVNGILGGWATVTIAGVTDWATNSTNGDDGLITAFSGPYSDITRLGPSAVPNNPAANVRIINGGTSGNITLAGGAFTQINTLKMDASAGPATIDPTNNSDVLMIGGSAGGGIIQTAASGALTIGTTAGDGRLTSGGALSLINDHTTNALTVNSTIADNGGDVVAVTKGGAGVLVLNGNNTYTGTTTVNAGTLRAGSSTAFGTALTASLGFGAGSTGLVQLNGNSMTVIGLNTNALVGAPIIESGSASAGTDTLTVNNVVDSLYAGILRDGSTRLLALTKTGAGSLTLSGANTFTGLTTVNAGTLAYGANDALGSGNVTVDGSTAILALGAFNDSVGTVILANGGSITGTTGVLTSAATYDVRSGSVSASLAGNVGLTKTTSGTVVLSGANTYTGVTTVNAGVLQAGSTTAFGAPGTAVLTFGAGSTGRVQLNGNSITLVGLNSNPTVGTPVIESGSGAVGTDILTINNAGANTYAGVLQDGSVTSLALTKAGAGVLTLSGSNSYSGETNINAGVLNIQSSNALGSIAGGTTVASGAVLQLQGNISVGAESLALNGTGISGTGALRSISGTNTYAGQITLLGASRINSDAGTLTLDVAVGDGIVGDQNLTFGGGGNIVVSDAIVTGTGSLTKDGSGTLTLQANNTYSGSTVVNAGTLKLDYSLVDDTKLFDATILTLGGGTVELSGGSHQEVVAGTVLTAGTLSTITRTSGSSVLQLNTITPGAGAVVNFVGAGIAGTDNLNNASGILGGWATITIGGVTDWAMNSTNTADGLITAYSGYTDITRLGTSAVPNTPAANVRIINGGTSGNITLAGGASTQINSLKMDASAGSATIDPTNNTDVLMIGDETGGGIIQSSTSGSLNVGTTAGDGRLTTGGLVNSTAATLNLVNDSTGNALVINAIIQDNGTVAADIVSIAKGGAGNVIFNGANTYTGTTTITAGSLTLGTSNVIGTGGVTVDGSTAVLAMGANSDSVGTVIVANGGSISGSGTLTSTGEFGVRSGSAAAILAGGVGLTKNTDGVFTLSNANTYTGVTTVNGGTLIAGNATSFGPTSNASLTVNNNGRVQMNGNSITITALNGSSASAIVESGSGTAGTDTLTIGHASNNSSFAGVLQDGSTRTLALTKTLASTLTLTGANSYSGATIVDAGILNIQNGTALGSTAGGTTVNNAAELQLQNNITIGAEALILNSTSVNGALRNISGNNTYGGGITLSQATRINSDGGTLTLDVASGNAITATNLALTFGGAGNITVNDAIATGLGTVTKDGNGTLVLAAANTYTGTTTISTGVLNVRNNTALGTTTAGTSVTGSAQLQLQGDITIGAEALTLNSNSGSGALRNMSGNNTYGGAITLSQATRINSDAGTLTLDVASGNAITATNLALTFGGAGNITVNDAIATGSSTVTKDGNGMLVLAAANTYTGTTTVNVGILNVQNNTALGTTAAGTTIANNAQLQLQGNLNNMAEALTLAGTGISNDGSLRNVSGNNTVTGVITLSASNPVRINADADTTLILDVSTGNAITGTQDLTFGGAGTISVNDNINISIGNLAKDGTGTLILRADNNYTGTTTVNGGVLQVGVSGIGDTGGTAAGQGALIVNAGATLAGSGTVSGVAGTTNHILSGILSPGDNAGTLNGTLTIQGNLNASASTAQLLLNLFTPTGTYATTSDLMNPGSAAYINALNSIATTFGTSSSGTLDRLVGTGSSVLTLSGNSTISVTYSGTGLQVGQVFNLLDWASITAGGFDTGGSQRGGGLLGDLLLPTFSDSMLAWDTTKFFSDGLVVVVSVPEPSKGMLLMLAVVAFHIRRRRSKN